MKTTQNLDSEPFALITTKRQIFCSSNASQLQSIMKSNSVADLEENRSQEEYRQLYFSVKKSNFNFIDLLQSRHSGIQTIKVISPSHREETILQKQGSLGFDQSIQKGYHISLNESMNNTWKKGGLKIIKYVARFLHQLKTKADKLKIKLMNSHIFSMLGDKSGDFREFQLGDYKKQENRLICKMLNKTSSIISTLFNMMSMQLNRIGIIYPESSFKIFWDSVVVCFIVINIFYIPMSLSFSLDKSSQMTQLLFETIPSYIFIAEIILNFNTAYYSQGVIHIKRSDIFFHYLRHNFLWDLLVAIPFILAQFNIPYIQFILLLRITRIRSMIQNVEDLLNAKEEVQAVLELGKLVYFLVLVAHMCSCGWHLLGRIEYENYADERSWLVFYGYYDQEWQNKYIVSLYWSVITTLTVGYGDIVPQTALERVFVIIVALVICGVFGYTISTIGEILKNLEERKAALKRSMKKVNIYIKQKQLNLQLSLKVRKYFEFKHQIDEQEQEQDDSVLNKLSGQLKSEVLIDIYKRVLLNSKFLKENIPDHLLSTLCQKVKQATFAPGYDIINVYEPASKLIFILDGKINSYFVSKGLDVLSKTDKEQTVGKFQKQHYQGEVIGELEFIVNSSYQFHFRAETFTSIAYIERSDFLQILAEDEECRQRFHEMKERLTYQKTYGRTCDVCKWTHQYKDCPFVFHQTNIYKIARQANLPVLQSRIKFERYRIMKKRRNINEHSNNVLQGLEFIINNGLLNEDQLNDKHLAKLGYGLSDSCLDRSLSEESNSNESQFVDNLSQAQKKKSSQYEKMRTSFLGHSKFKPAKKSTPIEEDIHQQVYQVNSQQTSTNSLNQQLGGIPAPNLRTSVTNGGLQKMETIIPQKLQLLTQQIQQQQQNNNNGSNSFYQQDTDCQLNLETKTQQQSQAGMHKYQIDIDSLKEYEFYFVAYNISKITTHLNRHRQGVYSQNKKRNLKDKLKSIRMNKSFNKSLNCSSRNLDDV